MKQDQTLRESETTLGADPVFDQQKSNNRAILKEELNYDGEW